MLRDRDGIRSLWTVAELASLIEIGSWRLKCRRRSIESAPTDAICVTLRRNMTDRPHQRASRPGKQSREEKLAQDSCVGAGALGVGPDLAEVNFRSWSIPIVAHEAAHHHTSSITPDASSTISTMRRNAASLT
jgi:hypothetical protein